MSTPVKKVVVKQGSTNLKPDDKIAFAHKVEDTCQKSAVFNTSQPCKDAMAVWMTKTDALEKNQKDKSTLLVLLQNANDKEASCLFEYDLAAEGFISAARTTAGPDRTIITQLGLELRADPVHVDDPFTPTGLKIVVLKGKKVPVLAWDAMPGAVMYVAQMSVLPASDPTWEVVYGRGKSRMLPPLVHGQLYGFRVAAVGKDGRQSGWTQIVQITG